MPPHFPISELPEYFPHPQPPTPFTPRVTIVLDTVHRAAPPVGAAGFCAPPFGAPHLRVVRRCGSFREGGAVLGGERGTENSPRAPTPVVFSIHEERSTKHEKRRTLFDIPSRRCGTVGAPFQVEASSGRLSPLPRSRGMRDLALCWLEWSCSADARPRPQSWATRLFGLGSVLRTCLNLTAPFCLFGERTSVTFKSRIEFSDLSHLLSIF